MRGDLLYLDILTSEKVKQNRFPNKNPLCGVKFFSFMFSCFCNTVVPMLTLMAAGLLCTSLLPVVSFCKCMFVIATTIYERVYCDIHGVPKRCPTFV